MQNKNCFDAIPFGNIIFKLYKSLVMTQSELQLLKENGLRWIKDNYNYITIKCILPTFLNACITLNN